MNQILFNNDTSSKKNKQKIKKLKITLFILLILIFFLFAYYIYNHFMSTKKEYISYSILDSYNIQRLYSNNSTITPIHLNENGDFFVIGSIEIPSINIEYPILSDFNDELLKIAPCRFFGPYPNEVGNLCIAAHNYDDNRFFGNLRNLEIGDKINIFNSNNYVISYYVYSKYETDKNETSCTSQNTNGNKEITLITCNNLNGNRLIIKAKESK